MAKFNEEKAGKEALKKILAEEKERPAKGTMAVVAGDKVQPQPKEDGAMQERKTRPCPECGVMNPNSAVLCEVCGNKMYSPDSLAKEKQKLMFTLNKRLGDAVLAGDKKLIQKFTEQIAKEAAASKGAYTVDKKGTAVQKKTTAVKVKKEVSVKPTHTCPCCNTITGRGSYFLMGHDGRTHSLLLKVKKEVMKAKELNPVMLKMYGEWKKSGFKSSMKQLAEAVA